MKEKYDVVIIGAGIGGLISGCYVARAGLRALIVEQHTKPGGYCTSFERAGYKFDAGVHYFGGIKSGILGRILSELNLKNKLEFERLDPTDKIIMPDNVTYIRTDPYDTLEEFKKAFPKEKNNIMHFFKFIMQKDTLDIYKKCKKLTFKIMLDNFFKSDELKANLGVLLGNIGTSPSQATAFAGIVLFRQHVLDPGYYPKGGMQRFPDILAECFKSNGGHLLLAKKVTKIIIKRQTVSGVVLSDGQRILADRVISNADATQTFNDLLEIKSKERGHLKNLFSSPSMFIAYLGLNQQFDGFLRDKFNICYFSTYDVDGAYSVSRDLFSEDIPFLVCTFPSSHCHDNLKKNTMSILTFALYESTNVWVERKEIVLKKLIDKASNLIPNLKDSITLQFCATPFDLFRYTLNRNGAFSGWLSTFSQANPSLMPQRTSIVNLYLAGQWCTLGYLPSGGIPQVAFSGRKAAELIIYDRKEKWDYTRLVSI